MSPAPSDPKARRHVIVHATDLHPDGGAAFAHGVALARDTKSKLYSIYACDGREPQREMPRAADLLTRWGREEAVEHEPVVHSCCEDPVDTMLDFIDAISPDLLVVGTHRSKGLKGFLKKHVSEGLARNVKMPTLFVPLGEDGFVQGGDGKVHLDRVLAPISSPEVARLTAETIVELVDDSDISGVEVFLMHVGKAPLDEAAIELPKSDRVRWKIEERSGSFVSEVLNCVADHRADLVVMPTHGHDSIGDVFRGSHTEKIIHKAPCPVLSVPM